MSIATNLSLHNRFEIVNAIAQFNFILLFLGCYLTLAAPGDLDVSFGVNGKIITDFGSFDRANAAALQIIDNKIVVAGRYFNSSTTREDVALARYNPNGTLDSTFDNDGKVTTAFPDGTLWGAESVAIQSDGKVVVAGRNRTLNSFFVIRYNTNGSLDTTFGTNGIVTTPINTPNGGQLSVIIMPETAKILVVGTIKDSQNNVWDGVCLVRYNTNGALDSTFGNGGIATRHLRLGNTVGFWGVQVSSAAIDFAERITVVGRGYFNTFTQIATARFNTNGAIDTSFGNQPSDPGWSLTRISNNGITFTEPNDVAIQNDGKILVAGFDTPASSTSDFALVRYDSNGILDNSFGSNGVVITQFGTGDETAQSVILQSDNKIVVGGFSNSVVNNFTSNNFALARYNQNGSLDSSFGTGGKVLTNFSVTIGTSTINGNESANEIFVQNDGKIVAAGTTQIGAPPDFAVARYEVLSSFSAPFDFDGDSKTDLSIFRPSGGEWWYLRSSDGGNRAFQFGISTDKLVPADFTGDGKTDIAFWRESTGEWFILRSEDNSYLSFPFGTAGDIPSTGYFDGDNKADFVIFRPSAGTWYILKSTGGTDIIGFGINGDQPVVADYDGDGIDDLAVYRPSNSQWWIRRSSLGIFAAQFGQAGDKTAVGDYTGDGKADVAFWRPANGTWYVLRSEDSSFYAFPFGATGDFPAPGDYDGDGKTDAAVFRPTSATWYLNRSSSGVQIVGFGANGDFPVPSSFVR